MDTVAKQHVAKKRILYIITKSVWGGAQKYVYDLATHLPPEQFDIHVALGGNGQLSQKLDEAHIAVHTIPSFQKSINPLKEVFAFFELLRLLFTLKPDIIHTNSSKAGALGGLAARIYTIVTPHKKIQIVFNYIIQ